MSLAGLVDIGARTDPGRDPNKQINEDAIGCREARHGYVVVVCDGMGGHEGGREASRIALAAVFETFDKASADVPAHAVLREAIEEANRQVAAFGGSKDPAEKPGSTIVAIVVHSAGTEVAHIGDSRLYGITGGRILQITKDHSVVQEMVDRGLLTPEAAKNHPDANRITRALGTHETIDVDVRATPLLHVAGDVFVLCTDGLSDLVTPEDILKLATSSSPEQAAGQLVDLANARGGHDNVSVMVVRTKESAIARAGMVAKTVAQTIAEEAPIPLVVPAFPSTPSLPHAPVTTIDGSPRRLPRGALLGLALVILGVIGAGVAVYLDDRAKHTHVDPVLVPTVEAGVVSSSSRSTVELAPQPPATVLPPVDSEPLKPLLRRDAGSHHHHDDDNQN